MLMEIGFGNWNISNNFTDYRIIHMRRIKSNAGILLVLSIMLGFGLTGCNQNTPEARAERFLNSLYRMEYQEAKTMATEETVKVLDMMEQFSSMMPDSVRENAKRIRIDIVSVEKQGEDRATITYTTTESEQENTLDMVRQNEEWLAQWDKSPGLDEGLDLDSEPAQENQEAQEGAESLEG